MAETAAQRWPQTAARRRADMIAAMRQSILARGYAETSLDHIIEKVGGSRRNIYQEFGNKEGLLVAVIEAIIDEVVRASFDSGVDEADPRAWLEGIGTRFVTNLLDPEVVELFRIVISTDAVSPEIVATLWRNGPDRFRALLIDWLRARVADGSLIVADVERAAMLLPEMMRGPLQMEALARRRRGVSPDEIADQVCGAVDLFLRGALPR